ncbi:DUF488 domain-containing protein [Pseudomonas sp. No.21]|jgi:uncharacterized protein (DUF488 family)|uniref:DUF488 domain-containing protein n=1 Tax=Pseudomonas tohonis TaxID=2725477 RepID=UPI001F3B9FFD|nr:DUF488 domain-containing protein [Pseudomonas tohonis]GJN46486.1 hypothetical protein TUM20249_24720 [Pseudomonas tohonis]
MNIYTAGYEGLSIDTFIARLQEAGIDKVLDVREYPLSRKPGFSKKAFAECLAKAGIAYEHEPALGCPKPVRKRYKEDGDWAAYERGFNAYIKTQDERLHGLLADAASERICMVCYEADARFCHRNLIAQRAHSLDSALQAVHLPLKATAVADLFPAVA